MATKRRILTKERFAKTWKKLENDLGQQVLLYLSDTEAECPNCYFDKVNRRSSGVCKVGVGSPNYFTVGRCPVCKGRGALVTTLRKCIDALVIWNPRSGGSANNMAFNEAGYAGATKVQIKTDICYLDMIKNSKYIVVDGVRCKLSNPPIVRGLGDNHLLVADFFTENKLNPNSGEIV